MKKRITHFDGLIIDEVQGTQGSINMSTSSKPFSFSKKTPGIAVKYVLEGQENYQTSNQHIILNKGQFLLFRQNTNFEAFNTRNIQTTKGLCINLEVFSDYDYSRLLRNDLLFNTPLYGTYSTSLGKHLLLLLQEGTKNIDFLAFETINNHLESHSLNLLNIEKRLAKDTKKKESLRVLIPQLFKTKEYLSLHFREKTTLDNLATISGISKYYLLRLFKKCFNTTPIEYIHQLRMTEAKELILRQNQSLTNIAYHVGYTDLPSFSNRFKATFGFPPSKYLDYLSEQ